MWERRDRLAVLLALVAVVSLCSVFILSHGTQFLMPGPLASAHGAIEKCSTCHTKSGNGKLSWLHGLTAGDPLADSKACLTCHKMPATAFNAHGASAETLLQSTKRLTKAAAQTPQPQSARAQNAAFPTHDVVARGLYCATCHQEHQGAGFKSEQDLQRAVPLLPRGEVRQLRRQSSEIRELSVQAAHADHLRPCRPFR